MLLRGKKAVIFGIANEKSIAWAIARLFHEQGAELAVTYAGEALEKRVRPLAESIAVPVGPATNVGSVTRLLTPPGASRLADWILLSNWLPQ